MGGTIKGLAAYRKAVRKFNCPDCYAEPGEKCKRLANRDFSEMEYVHDGRSFLHFEFYQD